MSTLQAATVILSKADLLKHWQGHRGLTRRVIEAFPENELFGFSIGGMRTASQLAIELLSIGAPALKAIVNRNAEPYTEEGFELQTKDQILAAWDAATQDINTFWAQLPEEDFEKTFNLFGQYEFPIIQNILYFIDNEIHHRGQMYVYLRAINIEPPFFWER